MATTKTLGGDRLGAGKKQQVTMHGFERSTHDLSFIWRNTQAPGTLVPFLSRVALPGDNWEIDLNAMVLTHPTVGPLFGSFKLQLDVFQCPIRLYNSWLHNNKLKVGNNMAQVQLPKAVFNLNPLDFEENATVPLEFQQINQSCLYSYLGIRGIGDGEINQINHAKNAIPILSYWDIYKNYYSNKMEEIGVVIHTENARVTQKPFTIKIRNLEDTADIYNGNGEGCYALEECNNLANGSRNFTVHLAWEPVNAVSIHFNSIRAIDYTGVGKYSPLGDTVAIALNQFTESDGIWSATGSWNNNRLADGILTQLLCGIAVDVNPRLSEVQEQINLTTFPLENIDKMRESILAHPGNQNWVIENDPQTTDSPFILPLKKALASDGYGQICAFFSQEGLGVKTYQSDIFNNWLNTEWIEGTGGINEITAVDTSEGSFDINTLNLAQKVYDMLNRIAVSGGSYEDWMSAVYDTDGYRKAETPMYMGGLSKEIVFQEVVSNAQSKVGDDTQPLGTLAGKGVLSNKHKGGKVNINVNEPSYIIGIVSITPRVDYSQGNNWDINLATMDDFHKPSLDEIGFQDLMTEQMAFWDVNVDEDRKSAGKQPAWLNYMTDYNRLHGNFADPRNEMYMTLARRYTADVATKSIKDLTTYIDPVKYNYAFAQTDLTAQNFWVQIACDITARRKMSAKLMPNL